MQISIVIPVWNEEENIEPLVLKIDSAMKNAGIEYEIIFVDDSSTDYTAYNIIMLSKTYPIRYVEKEGPRGKAQSLLQGFEYARYGLICMMDGDLQYDPATIPEMIKIVERGADVVVMNRVQPDMSVRRKILIGGYRMLFAKWLLGFDFDAQSGMKIFKREIIQRIPPRPHTWTFDIEFLHKARDAGYDIRSLDAPFSHRHAGASKHNLLIAIAQMSFEAIKLKMNESQTIPLSKKDAEEVGEGFHFKGKRYLPQTKLDVAESAFHSLNTQQIAAIFLIVALIVVGLIYDFHSSLIVLISALTCIYFADLLYNLLVILKSFAHKDIHISKMALENDSGKLPAYTILCPLFKEGIVVPQFVSAMQKLNYPKDKLQILLLLEEGDTDTIAKAQDLNLPSQFEICIIPHSKPQTKPKALNYGLKRARGEYVVVYDAEDMPEPDQLKTAATAFAALPQNIVCLQAKLSFYNTNYNLLTRLFTAEYSLWFNMVLEGLESVHSPIPLGGTSNHFRKSALLAMNGWDAFNVTEDCDLGIRIRQYGYDTAIIDSFTYEEANSRINNWINQRSRWIKGYIQTYFVHLRGDGSNGRLPHAWVHLVIGSKILSIFINPFMWAVTISYFLFRAKLGSTIDSFYPPQVLYMSVLSLLFGNFLYLYYYIIACVKKGQDDLVAYLWLVPLYWLGMSFAAWIAVFQLIFNPHYWSKTVHGYHLAA